MATSPPLVRLLTKEQTGLALLEELESQSATSLELINQLKKHSECNPGATAPGLPTMAGVFTTLAADTEVKAAFEPLRENMPASIHSTRAHHRGYFNDPVAAAGVSATTLAGLNTTATDDLEGQIMTTSGKLGLYGLTLPGATPGIEFAKIETEGTYQIDVSLLPIGRNEADNDTAPTFADPTAYAYRAFLVVMRPSVSTTVPFHVSEILSGAITRVNLSNAAANDNLPNAAYHRMWGHTLHLLANDEISIVVQRGRQLATYGGGDTDVLTFPKMVDSVSPNPTQDLHNYIDLLFLEE